MSVHDDPALRAKFIGIVNSILPARVVGSAVAIVRGNDPVVEQLGTGTLIAVADRHYVVTAAHVVAKARKLKAGMGITNAYQNFVLTAGEWIASAETGSVDQSAADIAAYPLSAEQVKKLDGKDFLRLRDIDFSNDLTGNYFELFGYPSVMCDSSQSEHKKVSLGGLQLGTTLFSGDNRSMANYDPRSHILLDASEFGLSDQNGMQMKLRGATGHRIPFASGLAGISGCAVWKVGNPSRSLDQWTASDCHVVAVQTGVYESQHAIKATRWALVLKLLASAFPEIRTAIGLYV